MSEEPAEGREEPTPVKEIQNQKLALIAGHAAADLVQLIAEKEEELLEAMADVTEEANLQDKKPIIKIGYGISLDPDANKMTTSLTFAVRRKLEIVRPMPDPSQPELPLESASMNE
jgi:hypothetical protein